MKPYYSQDGVDIYHGDALAVLASLPERSVQTVVTSPPYFGLRDYGTARWEGGSAECDHRAPNERRQMPHGDGRRNDSYADNRVNIAGAGAMFKCKCLRCGATRVDVQLGLEPTSAEYVANMVAVFREVRRVLHDSGTLWLNLGDSYAGGGMGGHIDHKAASGVAGRVVNKAVGLKPKDLIGIPWRVAFALQDAGWYLRSEIIWHKKNPMPESVTDRPSRDHEQIFLLAKSERYFYDAEAVKERCSESTHARVSQDLAAQVGSHRANGGGKTNGPMKAVIAGSTRKIAEAGSGIANNRSYESARALIVEKRNKRTVWSIGSESCSEAHFATFPKALIEPCIMAGTSERGCCSECGAPWRRVVERNGYRKTHGVNNAADDMHSHEAMRENGTRHGTTSVLSTGKVSCRETTGWQPGCTCNAAVVPCTVLDPFMGAGTTALVAKQLGRRAVGVELNAEYIDIAAKRLGQPALLTVDDFVAAAPPVQLTIAKQL